MAENALKILKDNETLAKYKTQAYEHSLNFSLKEILPKYENIYTRLVNKKTVV